MAKALQEAGADVFVVAPDRHPDLEGIAVHHPNRDPRDDRESHSSYRFQPNGFARTWLRWPDSDIVWARKATRAAIKACPFKPDWIFTTSPPESLHIAGARLKDHFEASWVADLRDSWLDTPLVRVRKNPLRRIGEAMIARRILSKADLITAVAAPVAAEAARYSGAPVKVLPHFVLKPRQAAPLQPSGRLHLVHTGSFSLSDAGRSILPVLNDFAAACAARCELHLHLAGRLTPQERALIHAHPFSERMTFHGVLDLEGSLTLQHSADALLITGSPEARVTPGKLAEYMSTGKPIIACGEGPWRDRVPNGQRAAVERMIELHAGASENADATLPDEREAAELLLDWMREASRAAP